MTEEALDSVGSSSPAVAVQGKWGRASWLGQPTSKVARPVLEGRLGTVWQRLPLAAERSDEDMEHVHQLRIAIRRAMAALRLFADLLPETAVQEVRERLRKVRLAADEARNWDVLSDLFQHCSDLPPGGAAPRIAEEIKARRRAAQQPIVAAYQELTAEKFDERIGRLLAELSSARHGKGKRRYALQAQCCLKPMLKRFFKAAAGDLSDEAALHRLRIRAKKLRYTMEMVAVAFKPSFRRKLYPRISMLQDILGIVNDHAMGRRFFREWAEKEEAPQEKGFLEGMTVAEARAFADVRQTFLAAWTPKAAAELRREFRKYCGV